MLALLFINRWFFANSGMNGSLIFLSRLLWVIALPVVMPGWGQKNHSCTCQGWWLRPKKLRWLCFFCLCVALTCCRRQKAGSRHQEKIFRSHAKGCRVKPIFCRRKKIFSRSREKDCARCPSRCGVKPIFRGRKKFFSGHRESRCGVKPIFRRRKKSYCRSCVKDCGRCAKNRRPLMSACEASDVFLSLLFFSSGKPSDDRG